MMFLVVGFQTPEHVNRMLRFRTSLLHKKKKQEFDQEDQEVLTTAPPWSTVIDERYIVVYFDLLPRRGKTWSWGSRFLGAISLSNFLDILGFHFRNHFFNIWGFHFGNRFLDILGFHAANALATILTSTSGTNVLDILGFHFRNHFLDILSFHFGNHVFSFFRHSDKTPRCIAPPI